MPIFRKDPCGIVCLVLTYLAVFYADYVVVRWIIIQTLHNSLWGAFHAVAFNSVVLLLMMSHMRAVFSDPGIVPLPQNVNHTVHHEPITAASANAVSGGWITIALGLIIVSESGTRNISCSFYSTLDCYPPTRSYS